MNRRIRGFSLLEIMVAMLIFSIIITTVYRLLSGSKDKLALSANSFSAIHLSSKVMTDLTEEARLNPTFLEMLQDFPDMLSQDFVTEGRSFYFRAGRDRKPPWGVIDLEDGGAIDKSDGVIYEQLKPFQVSVTARRGEASNASEPEMHLCELEIGIDWKEKDGMSRSYRIPLSQFSPAGPVPPEGLDIDDDELKKMIREYLFPALTNRTFDQAVSERSCDPDLAYHVGRIGVLTNSLVAILGSATGEISDLGRKRKPFLAFPNSDLVKIDLEIARKSEYGASILYNVLFDLVPSMEAVKDRADAARLKGIDYGPYSQGLKSFETLAPQIFPWLSKAAETYEWLLHDGFAFAISEREREFARGKTLEALRLMRALEKMPASRLTGFLAKEKKRVEGRNPAMVKFYIREEKLAVNPAVMKAGLPNLKAIVDRLEGKILPLASAVPELISRLPPPPAQ